MLDSLGRPKLNSLLSIVELMTYVPLMVIFLKSAGLRGAAIIWSVRAAADLAVRLLLLCRVLPAMRSHLWSICCAPAVAAVLTGFCVMPASTSSKLAVLLLSSVVYSLVVLCWSFSRDEKLLLQGKVLQLVNGW